MALRQAAGGGRGGEKVTWVLVTIKPAGGRRFWSMFPLRVPFQVPSFDPQPLPGFHFLDLASLSLLFFWRGTISEWFRFSFGFGFWKPVFLGGRHLGGGVGPV